jgi:hypothetical protein
MCRSGSVPLSLYSTTAATNVPPLPGGKSKRSDCKSEPQQQQHEKKKKKKNAGNSNSNSNSNSNGTGTHHTPSWGVRFQQVLKYAGLTVAGSLLLSGTAIALFWDDLKVCMCVVCSQCCSKAEMKRELAPSTTRSAERRGDAHRGSAGEVERVRVTCREVERVQ